MTEIFSIIELIKLGLETWVTHEKTKYLNKLYEYEKTLMLEITRGPINWDKRVIDECRANILLLSSRYVAERRAEIMGPKSLGT